MAALRLLLCATCLYVSLLSASRTVFQESPHAPPLWIDGQRTGCCADSDGHFARCVYFTGLHRNTCDIETILKSRIRIREREYDPWRTTDGARQWITGSVASGVFQVESESLGPAGVH